MPRQWHASKPDLDNLVKSVKDSLKGLVWIDDSQIARLFADKFYASGDESPGLTVELRAADELVFQPFVSQADSKGRLPPPEFQP